MYALARFLQACGIIVCPMALFYYFHHEGETRQFGLGTMEWMILGSSVVVFLLGRYLERRSSPPL